MTPQKNRRKYTGTKRQQNILEITQQEAEEALLGITSQIKTSMFADDEIVYQMRSMLATCYRKRFKRDYIIFNFADVVKKKGSVDTTQINQFRTLCNRVLELIGHDPIETNADLIENLR